MTSATHLAKSKPSRRYAISKLIRLSVVLGTVPGTCLGTAFGAMPAQAVVTTKTVQIAGRVLSFMSPPLAGNVRIGIVYQPDNAASSADERALVSIIGNGLQIENITLIAVPVPLARLASAQVGVYFLTANLGADAAKVGAQAALSRRLCITTDIAAAQQGACTVAVENDSAVTITINKVTAKDSGIDFVTAFLLMVTVI